MFFNELTGINNLKLSRKEGYKLRIINLEHKIKLLRIKLLKKGLKM